MEVKKLIKKRIERNEFAMLYLKDLSQLLDISTKGEYKVLLAIVERANYNENSIRIGKDIKEEIAIETGLSFPTVDKSVTKLYKMGILLRKKHAGKEVRGAYLINPKYFFKGEELERAKLFKLILEYEIK